MGKISTNWKTNPLSKEMDTFNIPIAIKGFSNGAGVNVGNPHVVFFGKSIDDLDIDKLGPKIENHIFFPKKTNVEFIEVINLQKIKMKVWERGAGATLACGSGACASVVACHKLGKIDDEVEIEFKGGIATAKWIDKGSVLLSGPAETVFHGQIDLRFL